MHMEMHEGFCLEGSLSVGSKNERQPKCAWYKTSSIVSGAQNSLSGNKRRLSGGTS